MPTHPHNTQPSAATTITKASAKHSTVTTSQAPRRILNTSTRQSRTLRFRLRRSHINNITFNVTSMITRRHPSNMTTQLRLRTNRNLRHTNIIRHMVPTASRPPTFIRQSHNHNISLLRINPTVTMISISRTTALRPILSTRQQRHNNVRIQIIRLHRPRLPTQVRHRKRLTHPNQTHRINQNSTKRLRTLKIRMMSTTRTNTRTLTTVNIIRRPNNRNRQNLINIILPIKSTRTHKTRRLHRTRNRLLNIRRKRNQLITRKYTRMMRTQLRHLPTHTPRPIRETIRSRPQIRQNSQRKPQQHL